MSVRITRGFALLAYCNDRLKLDVLSTIMHTHPVDILTRCSSGMKGNATRILWSQGWHSSAGGECSWNQVSPEWERSKWSTPTRRTLTGSESDTDQERQLRSMIYGDGWAYDSTHSHYKRAKPTQTDPKDDRAADPSLPLGSTSKTYDPRKDGGFLEEKGQWPRVVAFILIIRILETKVEA